MVIPSKPAGEEFASPCFKCTIIIPSLSSLILQVDEMAFQSVRYVRWEKQSTLFEWFDKNLARHTTAVCRACDFHSLTEE